MMERQIKTVIFGIGKHWNFINSFLSEELNIVAYMDNHVEGEVGGIKIYLPEQWQELHFDKIVVCAAGYKTKLEMMNQLLELGIEKDRIGFIEDFQRNYDTKVTVEGMGIVNIWKNGVVVRCENEIEYMIAQEIFAEEEYGFHTNENYFVIDIGMNIGCATLYFASQGNVTSVYGFEPFKGVYDKAKANIALNRKDIQEKIHIYNIGLSAADGNEKYIAHEGIYESAGIKKVQDGTGQSDHLIEIETKSASQIIRGLMSGHEEKCLMKIDCEGAEYGIFEDLINSGCMEKIDVIIMEWHIGKFRQLEKLLSKAGFTYVLNKTARDFGKCYAWK